MKGKALKMGVIGAGNMGWHHARVYSQLPGIQLIGIADVDETRGMPVAKRYGCKSYKDYREMLTREKLDAVSIVVPLYLHERIALHRQRSFNFY